MTVYIDPAGHLVADSLNELHAFAQRIGLRRQWFQDRRLPHYDLTTSRAKQRAIHEGVLIVTSREIVHVARKLREEREQLSSEQCPEE